MYANIFTRDKKTIAGKKRSVCKCDGTKNSHLRLFSLHMIKKPQSKRDKVEKY